MAIAHITYNASLPHGSQLRACLRQLQQGVEGLVDLVETMALMRDAGASTQYIVDQFGFPSTAVAEAAFAELDSLRGKLTTDGQVEFVHAALYQAFHKFG